VVFVTVGNARQGFSRLVSAVDALCGSGAFGAEPVLVQRGHTGGEPLAHCQSVDFLPSDEFERHLGDASLVVCHGGTTQLFAIRLGKVPIVMPRLRRFGEHINDHQVQLVQALAAEGLVVPAYEPGDLAAAVAEARRRRAQPVPSCTMVELVAEALEQLSGAPVR
jgi:UDP-N-acetylglucosamine transferase subunit ALG13